MEKKSIREITAVVFKAVTLAMGVAVVVLPLSITCHHAATDGYHVKCFLESFRQDVIAFSQFL